MIEEDREFVRQYFELPDDEVDVTRMSPWLLRIELNREMMLDKKLLMADVAERINNEFQSELTCIFNDDNAEKLILRVCGICILAAVSCSCSMLCHSQEE